MTTGRLPYDYLVCKLLDLLDLIALCCIYPDGFVFTRNLSSCESEI